jgi:hypothetical protein
MGNAQYLAKSAHVWERMHTTPSIPASTIMIRKDLHGPSNGIRPADAQDDGDIRSDSPEYRR